MSEITKLEKENARLTELCAKHADRAQELYESLDDLLQCLKHAALYENEHAAIDRAKAVLDQSEVEATLKQNELD